MNEFLRRTDVVDWDHPAVLRQAQELGRRGNALEIAKSCFEWVRDEVQHSHDYKKNPVTWRASDVLLTRTGYCFAKSHLLAALLRANGIAAGFCYQRLSVEGTGPPYTLHGFNAIDLPNYRWYRVDARGNRTGIDAQFTPPVEKLAFATRTADEVEFSNILPEPLDCVISFLQKSESWQDAWASLPDVGPHDFDAFGLTRRFS